MEITDNKGKKLWRPSWKGVLITLLVGSNIILIRMIEALVHKGQSLNNEIIQCNELRMNLTQSSTDQLRDRENGMMEIRKKLCGDTSEELGGCTVCPDGWLRHRENCFYFSSGKEYRTWNESREVCEEMGAHLLVIEDREQQEFIKRFSRLQTGQTKDKFWIGLYRDGDGWRWVDGGLYNTSLLHLSGSSGDCVQIHATAGYYKGGCQSSKQNWICQKRSLKI
ncbi:killer cell lectin-like receptor subfamily G member 1 [Rana temporaria]|uniref:killer cell lectin-like receptor subfamily G member 1 n=1 Tax=Rana temporaria TaxID=8407 RepID=UPI001AAC6DE4|nr:killer cell lectin-like receptor subfamily G member 1 [Rana temporaria]